MVIQEATCVRVKTTCREFCSIYSCSEEGSAVAQADQKGEAVTHEEPNPVFTQNRVNLALPQEVKGFPSDLQQGVWEQELTPCLYWWQRAGNWSQLELLQCRICIGDNDVFYEVQNGTCLLILSSQSCSL